MGDKHEPRQKVFHPKDDESTTLAPLALSQLQETKPQKSCPQLSLFFLMNEPLHNPYHCKDMLSSIQAPKAFFKDDLTNDSYWVQIREREKWRRTSKSKSRIFECLVMMFNLSKVAPNFWKSYLGTLVDESPRDNKVSINMVDLTSYIHNGHLANLRANLFQ